jgi:hypothetical protein
MTARRNFPSPRAVEVALKSHLARQGRAKAFVNVQQIPGKKDDLIYIITTESSLASQLQSFLEDRIGRRCPYTEGSFLLHGTDAERLLGK